VNSIQVHPGSEKNQINIFRNWRSYTVATTEAKQTLPRSSNNTRAFSRALTHPPPPRKSLHASPPRKVGQPLSRDEIYTAVKRRDHNVEGRIEGGLQNNTLTSITRYRSYVFRLPSHDGSMVSLERRYGRTGHCRPCMWIAARKCKFPRPCSQRCFGCRSLNFGKPNTDVIWRFEICSKTCSCSLWERNVHRKY